MANENELQLGMSVDTAEALENVKQFGAEFKRSTSEIKDQLAQAGKTEFGKNLGEDFDGINVTVKDLLERLEDLKVKFQEAPIGGEAWHRWSNEIKVVENELRKAKDQLNQTNAIVNTSRVQTGAFRTAVTQSTYALREINPALGSAVSALNPMIHGFNTASVRGQGFKAMLSAVGTQIVGPLGIISGITLLSTVIATVIRSKKDAAQATREYEASLSSLRSELEKASLETLRKREVQLMVELLQAKAKAEKEITDAYNENMVNRPNVMRSRDSFSATEETKNQIKLLEDQIRLVQKYTNELGLPRQIKNKIRELEELREGLIDQEEIDLVNKQIAQQQELLSTILGKTKAEKDSFEANTAKLKQELLYIDKMLQGNLHLRDRIIYLERQRELVKELTNYLSEYIKMDAKGFSELFIQKDKDSWRPFLKMYDPVEKPKPFKESTAELELQLALTDSLTEGYRSAGSALAGAMSQSAIAFKQANSMLQIFINELIRATVQALALRGVMAFFNLLFGGPSIISGGGGGSAAEAIEAGAAGGGGGLFKSSVAPTPGANYNAINVNVNSKPIAMETKLRGRDIYLVQKKENDYRKRYM